jgi:hypothetical protein
MSAIDQAERSEAGDAVLHLTPKFSGTFSLQNHPMGSTAITD